MRDTGTWSVSTTWTKFSEGSALTLGMGLFKKWFLKKKKKISQRNNQGNCLVENVTKECVTCDMKCLIQHKLLWSEGTWAQSTLGKHWLCLLFLFLGNRKNRKGLKTGNQNWTGDASSFHFWSLRSPYWRGPEGWGQVVKREGSAREKHEELLVPREPEASSKMTWIGKNVLVFFKYLIT